MLDREFCHNLTFLPLGASVFHKHMSSFIFQFSHFEVYNTYFFTLWSVDFTLQNFGLTSLKWRLYTSNCIIQTSKCFKCIIHSFKCIIQTFKCELYSLKSLTMTLKTTTNQLKLLCWSKNAAFLYFQYFDDYINMLKFVSNNLIICILTGLGAVARRGVISLPIRSNLNMNQGHRSGVVCQLRHSQRNNGRGLNQSYDKSPYTLRKIQKAAWQHKNAIKNSITQRFWTDLGRSVGVTTAAQLVWLNRFTRAQPSHLSQ